MMRGIGIYWVLTDANKLFNASQEENAYSHTIEFMIEVLEKATKSPTLGYKKIVDGHDADERHNEQLQEE